jgi:hypothetical protein
MNEATRALMDVWYGQYIPLDYNKELDWDEAFEHKFPNPEKLTIIKDEFEHLSNEAKEVVGLIYNAPYTILQLLSTRKRETITHRSIEQYLLASGWSRLKVRRTLKELKNFSQNL